MTAHSEPIGTSAHESGVREDYIQAGITPGRLGMWLFLAGELVIFGGLIACYVLYRMAHPEWALHAQNTVWQIGTFNTLVLLTSSLTVVLAYKAIDEGDAQRSVKLLLVTIGLGALFLVIKGFEYSHEFHGGFTPATNLFWSFYFFMTGLHAVHILGGLVALGIICKGLKKKKNKWAVEYVGLYWHLVDVVWIFLFPLLYIAK